jgi:2-isopropylmalate synthase
MLKQPQIKYSAFPPIPNAHRRWPDVQITRSPIWLSTDLRDGNQSLIEPMDIERKLRMFHMLVAIGFKEIEVGFPSASQTEFDFLRVLIQQNLVPPDVTISVLTQARQHLIERTFESLEGAPRAMVHLYNATAPIMRGQVLNLNDDEVIELATKHAKLMQDLAAQRPRTEWIFEYTPEMFSGTELPYAKRIVDAVTEVWQPTPQHPCVINLPSTVELSSPNIFADMVEWMHNHIARREAIILSVHPHNDRGTGTAAAELALMAGAQRLEGCLFGNGERTGNLDLVNVALNLYTQGISPNLDFSDIDEVRRCAEHCNRIPVHPRHPYVGDLVYTSFSGSHQDAIKKVLSLRNPTDAWNVPYLPIDPQDLGRTYEAVIRVNSQSGKGGIAYLLEKDHGLELPRRLQIEFSQVVQTVMDRAGTELKSDDLWRIFQAEYQLNQTAVSGVAMAQGEGEKSTLQASVQWAGEKIDLKGQGSGPIEAFVNGFNAVTAMGVSVLDYREHALGRGANAKAIAYLEVQINGVATYGVGIDENIIQASLSAIVCAANRASQNTEKKP